MIKKLLKGTQVRFLAWIIKKNNQLIQKTCYMSIFRRILSNFDVS